MLHNLKQSLMNLIILVLTTVNRELSDLHKGMMGNFRWFFMRKMARFNTCQYLAKFFRRKTYTLSEDVNDATISNSIFVDVDIDEIMKKLKKDGIYAGLNLPKHIVDDIRKFAYHTPCYANDSVDLGFYYHDKEIIFKEKEMNVIIGNYYNTSQCDAIQKVINDPVLTEISRRYLDNEITNQGHKLWWSFPTEVGLHHRYKYGQTFHYDLDDYAALKFFFHLTDVSTTSGPHVCVLGSHRSKTFLHKVLRGYWSDAMIIRKYKKENIKTIYARAGEGFIEDAFCLHKGTIPENEDRLILAVEYTMRDYGMQHNLKSENQLKLILNESGSS